MSSLAQPLTAEGRQGRYARVNDQLDPSENLKLKKTFFTSLQRCMENFFTLKKEVGRSRPLKSVYSGTFRRLSPFPHSLLTLHTRRAEKGLEKRAERGSSSSSFRSRRQEQDGTPDKLGNRNFISSLLASPPPFPPMLQGSKRRAGGRLLCEKREGALNVCKRDLAKKRRGSEMEEFAKKSASRARRLLRHVQHPYFSPQTQ